MNPFAFFVGCPRSGTTLLGRIGDAHPELAVIHETRFIVDCWDRRVGLTKDGWVTSAFVEGLSHHPRFPTLQMEAGAVADLLEGDGPIRYADFLATLFDLYGSHRGKRLVGDKTPGYVRFLPTLNELWPHAKFAHIIRDGRDVCLSVLDWQKGATGFSTFEDDPLMTAGVWWEWYVRLGREAGSRLGAGLYHEIGYESLVSEPERETRALAEFLGLGHSDAMLRFHEGRTRPDPGLSAKSAWLPVTGGLRDWRSQMDRDEALRFEAAAGDLLDELGYERAAASVPRAAHERARSIRRRFAQEATARGRPVPRAWSEVSA